MMAHRVSERTAVLLIVVRGLRTAWGGTASQPLTKSLVAVPVAMWVLPAIDTVRGQIELTKDWPSRPSGSTT